MCCRWLQKRVPTLVPGIWGSKWCVKAATVKKPRLTQTRSRSACNSKPPQPESGLLCTRRVGHRPCNNQRPSSIPSKQAVTRQAMQAKLQGGHPPTMPCAMHVFQLCRKRRPATVSAAATAWPPPHHHPWWGVAPLLTSQPGIGSRRLACALLAWQ